MICLIFYQILVQRVFRPKVHNLEKFYSSPHWHTTGNNSYNARDLNLVVGDYLIESPSQHASRYYETTTYYDIFMKITLMMVLNGLLDQSPCLIITF